MHNVGVWSMTVACVMGGKARQWRKSVQKRDGGKLYDSYLIKLLVLLSLDSTTEFPGKALGNEHRFGG